jgi:nicotinamidase-related amidase
VYGKEAGVSDRSAVVVIDVQRGLIDGFEADWHQTLPTINELVTRAHNAGVPVVFVQHCGAATEHPLHRSRPGWALHSTLDVQPEDLLVEKTWSDAFRDTSLDARLRNAAVTRLVLVGAQTEYCVDTTARIAASLGYHVDLVADGHTTSENAILSREQIVDHHNQTLANLACDGVSVRVVPSAEIRFS